MVEINLDNIKYNEYKKINKKFKTGDRVCYKQYPDICIGSISPDSFICNYDGQYYIFTSNEWFEHFAPYGGPNTLMIKEDDITLFKIN